MRDSVSSPRPRRSPQQIQLPAAAGLAMNKGSGVLRMCWSAAPARGGVFALAAHYRESVQAFLGALAAQHAVKSQFRHHDPATETQDWNLAPTNSFVGRISA